MNDVPPCDLAELLVIGAQVLRRRHTSPACAIPLFDKLHVCHESDYRSRMVEVALLDDVFHYDP